MTLSRNRLTECVTGTFKVSIVISVAFKKDFIHYNIDLKRTITFYVVSVRILRLFTNRITVNYLVIAYFSNIKRSIKTIDNVPDQLYIKEALKNARGFNYKVVKKSG